MKFRPPSPPQKRPLPGHISKGRGADLAATLQEGLKFHQSGRLQEARACYQKILTVDSRHFDALQLLAVLEKGLGRHAIALTLFDRALAISKTNAAVFSNRGNTLKELKRLDEALVSYEEAIRIKPDYADAFYNRGVTLSELKRLEEALLSYAEAIRLEPNDAKVLYKQGITLNELKRHDEALASFEEAIRIKPDYAEAFSNRGSALYALKRLNESLASYDSAIRLKPDYAEAFSNRGNALKELARLDEALASYENAIRIKPDYAEAFSNRGITLKALKRLDEALMSYEEAIRIKPDSADAHYNRGITLHELKRLDEALASFEKAIRIKPNFADAYANRGLTLKELKRLDEALSSYKEAIRIRPEDAETFWNLSLALLLMGRFEDGWSLYEWRLKKDDIRGNYYNGPETAWRGDEIIAGERLLLHCEQGLGDSIQFVRYVPSVVALGAQVLFQVQKPVLSLFRSMNLPVTLVAKGDPIPDFDAYCPLMSLPYVFKTTVETIPAPIPYVRADEVKVIHWQRQLGSHHALRVGLVWSGSSSHKNDANRSIPLELMLPLLELPIQWHALQKEHRASDQVVLDQEPRIKRHEDALEDFSDTAALIACLDIVISVDTSVAHLAGAMGKQVWVLLPFVPDFRWLLDREDSPWYPTARLFRQDERRDWHVVLSAVRDSLSALLCEGE